MSPSTHASLPTAAAAGGGPARPSRKRGVALPDLVGRPASSCVAELRKLGLKPSSVPEPVADPLQAGVVVAQDPPAGEIVSAGARVRIEIGDHSLFDARAYADPGGPAEQKRVAPAHDPVEAIPPIPSPLELLEYGQPAAAVEQRPDTVDWPLPSVQPMGHRAGSGRRELHDDYDPEAIEDPFADETHPGPEPEPRPGEPADPPSRSERAATAVGTLEPAVLWTRRQRWLVALSLGLLLLLVCLTLVTGSGAHAQAHGAAHTAGGAAEARVLTATVTVPRAPVRRGHRS